MLDRHYLYRFLGFFVLFFLCAVLFRIAWIGQQQETLAQQALAQHHPERAMVYYARALHAYLPFAPAQQQRLQAMMALAEQLEAEQPVLALQAWRRMRAALLACRTVFYQPFTAALQRANQHIAHLAAQSDEQGKMTKAAIEAEALAQLQMPPHDVSAFWGMAQFLFLCAWVLLCACLIWYWSACSWRHRGSYLVLALSLWLGYLFALARA